MRFVSLGSRNGTCMAYYCSMGLLSILRANEMRQTGMTVISIVVLIYAGFCVFMYASQRNAIYYPTPEVHVPDAADVRLESDGETLKIWLLAHGNGPNAIIYFGGNAEDVSGNIPDFRNFFPQHNVFLVNYRGYGGRGSPALYAP